MLKYTQFLLVVAFICHSSAVEHYLDLRFEYPEQDLMKMTTEFLQSTRDLIPINDKNSFEVSNGQNVTIESENEGDHTGPKTNTTSPESEIKHRLGSKEKPAKSCKELLEKNILNLSLPQKYWIKTCDEELLQVECPQKDEPSGVNVNFTSETDPMNETSHLVPNSSVDVSIEGKQENATLNNVEKNDLPIAQHSSPPPEKNTTADEQDKKGRENVQEHQWNTFDLDSEAPSGLPETLEDFEKDDADSKKKKDMLQNLLAKNILGRDKISNSVLRTSVPKEQSAKLKKLSGMRLSPEKEEERVGTDRKVPLYKAAAPLVHKNSKGKKAQASATAETPKSDFKGASAKTEEKSKPNMKLLYKKPMKSGKSASLKEKIDN